MAPLNYCQVLLLTITTGRIYWQVLKSLLRTEIHRNWLSYYKYTVLKFVSVLLTHPPNLCVDFFGPSSFVRLEVSDPHVLPPLAQNTTQKSCLIHIPETYISLRTTPYPSPSASQPVNTHLIRLVWKGVGERTSKLDYCFHGPTVRGLEGTYKAKVMLRVVCSWGGLLL